MPEQDKLAELEASGAVLDRHNFEVWNKHLAYKMENLRAANMDTISGGNVLDFGCGPGSYGILLGLKNNVVGVDIAMQAVRQARDRAKQFRSNFNPICGDGESLCLRPNSLDLCLSGWAIHHLPSVKQITREFYELLKPNGLLLIVEPNEDSFGMRFARFFEDFMRGIVIKSGLDTPNRTTHTNQEYQEALKTSGFHVLSVFTHYNGETSEIPRDVGFAKGMALRTMVYARHISLWFSTHVLRDGAEIFFIARKPSDSPLDSGNIWLTSPPNASQQILNLPNKWFIKGHGATQRGLKSTVD
jgi:SAM-dependent methyltransferase